MEQPLDRQSRLPPGQYELGEFPRFGLSKFANRFPTDTERIHLWIAGDVDEPLEVSKEIQELHRVEQTSDFHCVTTWSFRSVQWSGFRFSEFYDRIVVPRARPKPGASFVVLRSQDGYVTSLPLEDLLVETVLLADRMSGEPLPMAHGAPLRLVAPAHYGYKNAKHLSRVEFWHDDRHLRSPAYRFMDHPRARVAMEERGRGFPGWFLRYLYRPLVRPAIWQFKRAIRTRR